MVQFSRFYLNGQLVRIAKEGDFSQDSYEQATWSKRQVITVSFCFVTYQQCCAKALSVEPVKVVVKTEESRWNSLFRRSFCLWW
jgi:hypothetical protein